MGKTTISWTEETWNPIRGCSRISPGCQNCYAETIAMRFSGPGQPFHGYAERGKGWTRVVHMEPRILAEALSWRKPRLVFISMSDAFHENLTNLEIAALFGVMAAARSATFQILTKRSARAREWFEWLATEAYDTAPENAHDRMSPVWMLNICQRAAYDMVKQVGCAPADVMRADDTWPLPNVWIGASVEYQEYADERIPALLDTPAVVRFLSCEPLLGPIDLTRVKHPRLSSGYVNALRGGSSTARGRNVKIYPDRVHWVIAGCESGHGARPCDVDWLRSVRDQCASHGVAYFLKQAVGTIHDNYESRGLGAVEADKGSRAKGRGFGGPVIELPYLDGEQHAEMPEVHR